MAYYGYVRTSKEQEADRRGMDPETQRRAIIAAGVPERQVYSDIDVSGFAGVATRNGWRALDARLQRGDTLVIAALDRVGRRSIDVMGAIYSLVNRGVRLRSLADTETWAEGLDADPDSVEWITATLIAQVFAFAAQLERQAIARRTRAGLERARAEGKRLGRPPALTEETLTAIQQDLAEGMPVAAAARKYAIPRTTLIGYLERSTRN